MYEAEPDVREVLALGLHPDDIAAPPVEVWPENWTAFVLFSDLRTQWRIGTVGITGLDYNVLFKKMERMNLSNEAYNSIEDDVRLMEFEALTAVKSQT